MFQLVFLILMPAFSASRGPFCNVSQSLVAVMSCQEVSGPQIHCSAAVVNHLLVLKRTHGHYIAQYRLLGPSANYNHYKAIKTASRELLGAMESFHTFLLETYIQHQNASDENCVSMFYLEKYILQVRDKSSYDSYEVWIDYCFPVLAGLQFILGMLGNITILAIFIKHQDMRTGPNKVILNLAVGDMLLLVTNVVVFYARYRWLPIAVASSTCYVMSYSRTAGIAASVYSTVVLSMLRFLVTASSPGSKTHNFLKKYFKIPILLVLVWILAGLAGTFDAFDATSMCEFTTGTARQYIKFACICLLPLAAISAFSVATSRIMHKSVQELPGEQTPGLLREIGARQRGAKVILSLVVVFCITYLPLSIYMLFGDNYGPTDYIYVFSTQLAIPLTSCLNPLALCVGSAKFRVHFNNYLCKCCFQKKASSGPQQTVELQVDPRNRTRL